MAILVGGGETGRILSVGRSLKILIKLGLNFSNKTLNKGLKCDQLQFIKEIKQRIIANMVEESKGPKKIKPEELISRFRSKEDLYKYLT